MWVDDVVLYGSRCVQSSRRVAEAVDTAADERAGSCSNDAANKHASYLPCLHALDLLHPGCHVSQQDGVLTAWKMHHMACSAAKAGTRTMELPAHFQGPQAVGLKSGPAE